MKILGIETSCDETAAAVVEDGTKILSNVVASSAEMHVKTGGIIPEQAARQQVKSLIPVIKQSLAEVEGGQWTVDKKIKALNTDPQTLVTNVDAIAITVGPGLIGSLLVGVETAKTLACLWKKPIVPVNHLVAHIYANWLEYSKQWTVNSGQQEGKRQAEHRTLNTEHNTPQFPALCLVVSGGHTDLVLMKKHGQLKWLGGTRDDAAGETFDKTARLLGLGYPGGPEISKEAEEYFNELRIMNYELLNLFPRPMIDEKNFDWSFSGLKTSVLRTVQSTKNIEQRVPEIAAEIQEAIVDVLVEKTLRAAKKYKPKSLLLAGGVAANKRLRVKFQDSIKQLTNQQINFFVPPPALCTDNAAYIAACACFNYSPISWQKITENPRLTIAGQL